MANKPESERRPIEIVWEEPPVVPGKNMFTGRG